MLVLEGFQQHVPKGYIYFSVFFSMVVEMLNIRLMKKMKKKETRTAFDIEEMHALHKDD